MCYSISALTAILIAVMIVINGELAAVYGTYAATVIAHIVGTIVATGILAVKKEKPLHGQKLPAGLYLGGAIGVATVIFNNLAFAKISVLLIIALSLFGQTITALIIDQFGFFDMPVKKFNKSKLIGLLFVSIGIACLLPNSEMVVVPAILSLLTGVSVVTARSVNAQLAQKTSVSIGTWYNHIIGLILSVIIMFIANGTSMASASAAASPPPWIFLGGAIGCFVVVLSNICTGKMPAFQMTLILFIGQIFTGIILDALLLHSFSGATLAGGIFAMLGLSINVLLDQKSIKA